MPVPRGIDLLMPTLEDAFPTVREALAEHFGGPADEVERPDPFEAMIAVLLERELECDHLRRGARGAWRSGAAHAGTPGPRRRARDP